MTELPVLVVKALADAGYDLVGGVGEEWFVARVSGASARVGVRSVAQGTILAVSETGMARRIGLQASDHAPPTGMADVGLADSAAKVYQALRVLHTLQTHPAALLSATVEARLAAIPETERTREVRQRIGQEVFREALMELWEGRCALSGVALPPALLRASHAKPWARSSDTERLDPFNGLLLAVHFDALFDQGLIAFGDDGQIMMSSQLTAEAQRFMKLDVHQRLRFVLPGHLDYLRHHRTSVFMA